MCVERNMTRKRWRRACRERFVMSQSSTLPRVMWIRLCACWNVLSSGVQANQRLQDLPRVRSLLASLWDQDMGRHTSRCPSTRLIRYPNGCGTCVSKPCQRGKWRLTDRHDVQPHGELIETLVVVSRCLLRMVVCENIVGTCQSASSWCWCVRGGRTDKADTDWWWENRKDVTLLRKGNEKAIMRDWLRLRVSEQSYVLTHETSLC